MPGSPAILATAITSHWEYVILSVAAAAIASSVVINFALHAAGRGVAIAEERIFVSTLTMTSFFIAVFLLAWYGVARVPLSTKAELAARIAGSGLVVFSAGFNIAGRIALGRFWSDRIEIVTGHAVVRTWPYSWCRHPLYGSLVVFGVGMGTLTLNPVVVAATLVIFLPAIRYRAIREEKLLLRACGETYRDMQLQVPMLLPRIPEALSRGLRAMIGGVQIWAAATAVLDLMLLSAYLTLGLSFVMARDDFRIVYKVMPTAIVLCVTVALYLPDFVFLLWLPAVVTTLSVTGQCPGTLLLRLART